MPVLMIPPSCDIYNLPESVDQVNDPAVFSGAFAQGVTARTNWRSVQPRQPSSITSDPNDPSWNWSFIDQTIGQATTNRKKFFLQIHPQASHSPQWFRNLNTVQFYTDTTGAQIWIWWDPVATQYWNAVMQAVATRYGANPFFTIMTPQLAEGSGGDWDVPHTHADIVALQAAPYNYTSDRLVNAHTALINFMRGILPNQILTLQCGTNGNLDPTPHYVCQNIAIQMQALYPNNFAIQKDGLQPTTPPFPPPTSGTDYAIFSLVTPGTIFTQQFFWWAFTDTSYKLNKGNPAPPLLVLQNSFNVAVNYKFRSIQVYQNDVLGVQNTPVFGARLVGRHHATISTSSQTDIQNSGTQI